MSKEKPPRISGRDFTLIWLGAFLGAILSRVLDWVVSEFRVPPIVPEQYQLLVALVGWFFVFLLFSLIVTVVVVSALSRLGIIRES